MFRRRQDTQHNHTQHNDSQHNDTQYNNTHHNDIQHTNKENATLSIMAVSFILNVTCDPYMLNVAMHNVIVLSVVAPFRALALSHFLM